MRPYAEEFIEALAKYYEIVIFTAAMPDYANFIIDIIDKSQVVSGRLYRDHCICKDNVYIKVKIKCNIGHFNSGKEHHQGDYR